MKKRIAVGVLCVVLAFSLVGCAAMQSIGEWIGVAAEKVCNFSVADSQEAQAAKKFISATAGIVGLVISTVSVGGVQINITQTMAEQTFDLVTEAAQTGACVILQDLQAALAYFDELQAKYNEVAMARGLKAIEVPTLINLRIKAIR